MEARCVSRALRAAGWFALGLGVCFTCPATRSAQARVTDLAGWCFDRAAGAWRGER
jgi:hypothetical protein